MTSSKDAGRFSDLEIQVLSSLLYEDQAVLTGQDTAMTVILRSYIVRRALQGLASLA